MWDETINVLNPNFEFIDCIRLSVPANTKTALQNRFGDYTRLYLLLSKHIHIINEYKKFR
jgi:hypothetical protein